MDTKHMNRCFPIIKGKLFDCLKDSEKDILLTLTLKKLSTMDHLPGCKDSHLSGVVSKSQKFFEQQS